MLCSLLWLLSVLGILLPGPLAASVEYDDKSPIFKTWSKDPDGPHYAALENEQLVTYRGSPDNPELAL